MTNYQSVYEEIEINCEDLEMAKKVASSLTEYFKDSKMYTDATVSEKLKSVYLQESKILAENIGKIKIANLTSDEVESKINTFIKNYNTALFDRTERIKDRAKSISSGFNEVYAGYFEIEDPVELEEGFYTVNVKFDNEDVPVSVVPDGEYFEIEGMLDEKDVRNEVFKALEYLGFKLPDLDITIADYSYDDYEKVVEKFMDDEEARRYDYMERD